MNAQSATQRTTVLVETSPPDPLSRRAATVEGVAALALRVREEYVEMPGLRLAAPQAARSFGASDVAHAVLDELRHAWC